MASATATATMAAAGFDKRASTASSSLQTPGSASFPSELRSPLAGSPGFLKREHDLKTPITPPSAYLDFLKSMSPAILSPAPTSTSASFSFNDKPACKVADAPTEKSSISPPNSQPSLSRNTSYDSNSSTTSTATDRSTISINSTSTNNTRIRPESPRITIPPSPFVKPGPRSARTPRRLQIPQSPFSPAPPSAHSISSPYQSTPLSAAPWSASFSPRDVDTEANGKPGRMSVRQVVTRTVTYCRTPLEPAPKGKRRKIEGSAPELKASPELSTVKLEKVEEKESTPQETIPETAPTPPTEPTKDA